MFRAVYTWVLGDEFWSFKILKGNLANSTLWNGDVAGMLMPKSFIPGFLGSFWVGRMSLGIVSLNFECLSLLFPEFMWNIKKSWENPPEFWEFP